MAYGSPERLEDVPAYYADIRGGRPISPENLEDLVARYRALGVEEHNPLNAITEETRAALERGARPAGLHRDEALDAAHRRRRRGRARGRRRRRRRPRARAALLAPVDRRLPRAARGGARAVVPSCASSRAGISSSRSSTSSRRACAAREAHVVFTAHSLPARILDEGDPYQEQLHETARLSRERAALARMVLLATSRESPTGEPWLGPDILDHLGDAARARRRATSSSAPSASSRITSRSAGTSTSRRRTGRASSE